MKIPLPEEVPGIDLEVVVSLDGARGNAIEN